MRRAVLCFFWSAYGLLAGCSAGEDEEFECTDAPAGPECSTSLDTPATCHRAGGCWMRFFAGEGCDCRTRDAGKPCRTRLDCESQCITSVYFANDEACAAATEGTCAGWEFVFGCGCFLDSDGTGFPMCTD